MCVEGPLAVDHLYYASILYSINDISLKPWFGPAGSLWSPGPSEESTTGSFHHERYSGPISGLSAHRRSQFRRRLRHAAASGAGPGAGPRLDHHGGPHRLFCDRPVYARPDRPQCRHLYRQPPQGRRGCHRRDRGLCVDAHRHHPPDRDLPAGLCRPAGRPERFCRYPGLRLRSDHPGRPAPVEKVRRG